MTSLVPGPLTGDREVMTTTHRILGSLRRLWDDQRELGERQALIDRPWDEEYLHWSFDGQRWHLHGTLLPPDGRRRSVTSGGWCLGQRRP